MIEHVNKAIERKRHVICMVSILIILCSPVPTRAILLLSNHSHLDLSSTQAPTYFYPTPLAPARGSYCPTCIDSPNHVTTYSLIIFPLTVVPPAKISPILPQTNLGD